MAKNTAILLSGNVYCDWNAFTFASPMPDRLQTGDLVIWSWSGDSKKPSSKSQSGLLRVSVFDGKKRRLLKVKHTRVHPVLRYRDEAEREKRLGPLVSELRALKSRHAIIATRGYEVAPVGYLAPPLVLPTTNIARTRRTIAARTSTKEPATAQSKEPANEAQSNGTQSSGAVNTNAAANRKPVQGSLF